MKRNRAEDDLQRAVLEMCALLRVDKRAIYFHVPNGGARTAVEGAILKGLGVRDGSPDLLFLARGGAFCLELKAGRGRLSSSQLEFRDNCYRLGIPYAVARDVIEAESSLRRWGLLPTPGEPRTWAGKAS